MTPGASLIALRFSLYTSNGRLVSFPVHVFTARVCNEVFLYKEWTPAHIGKAVFEEKHPAILGGMFAIWNDHAGNGISVKDIHHRVFPALQTLAVKTWTGKETSLPFEVYNEKRSAISEAPGVNQLGRIGKSPALGERNNSVPLFSGAPVMSKLTV